MIQITNLEHRLPNSWAPKTKAQLAALHCPAEFLLFGGAAGSLKSTTMLVAFAQQIDNPRERCIIFRKSYPEIRFLMDRSIELYTQMGATLKDFNKTEKIWHFPSGATIEFKYIARDGDVYKYQGPEFTKMGFDESTHFLQEQMRYLVNSRGRSKDPSLKQQVFCATNPGGIGHGYHKHVFIGPKCTHCLKKPLPGTRIPGKIYTDAKWLDGIDVGLTTCFIPGLVTDHDLYGKAGEHYVKRLKGLSTAMMKALLEGCWEAFEGQYFDVWTPDIHVIKADRLDELVKPWWPHWTATDYGFAHAASSHLFCKSDTGRIYVRKEDVAHRVNAENYARGLKGLWWDRYKPVASYLSPDAFKVDGSDDEDLSRAQRMTQASDIGFERAFNARVAGWSMCYDLLKETALSPGDDAPGGMQISDECELLLKAIPTRIHNESPNPSRKEQKEDIKKTTDDEDDAADDWRYGVATHIIQGEKSLEQRVAERVTSHDPTSAMIQRLMAMQEFKQSSGPVNMYPRGRTR